MNYIRHLNAFFAHVKTDNRLTASHVSLYMALFQYWNFNRFQNPFSIYRENIMQLSKIGSKNTYHKCIRQLHEAKYIYYHPAVNRFHLVRISVIPLDKQEQPLERYKQLDLFESPSPEGEGFRVRPGTDIDTGSVPKVGQISTDIDTVPVSKMGHIIKPNINKQRETPTHEIFKRNKKIQDAINDFGGVSKMGHSKLPSPSGEGSGVRPTLNEVEAYFQQNNYPPDEAKKFFNHYKALGWKIQGKTPIEDWKPLVEKWMTNAAKWNDNKQQPSVPATTEINYLYESFLEGKKIFHQITPAHFDQLKLQLDDEVMKQAGQERISQVSGTNQHSINEIWKAYLTNDPNNELVQKDKPNLIALAKRIAVFKHFHTLKQSGKTTLE